MGDGYQREGLMTTFDPYDHLPNPLRFSLGVLEDFIGSLDGKTIATPTNDEGFIDDGTVDAEDAVKAFNAIVAALSAVAKGKRP